MASAFDKTDRAYERELRAAYLDIACPVCDAPIGKTCNAAKGGGVEMATWTHKERRDRSRRRRVAPR